MKFWIIWVAFFSSSAFAEEPLSVFTGTLGKANIVVELDLNKPDEVTGRYFYQKHRLDLPLNGTLKDNELSLNEGADDFDDTARPTLTLDHDDQGNLQGTWTDTAGKSLPLMLTPAVLPDAPDDSFPGSLVHSDSYEYLRLSGLSLVEGKRQEFMGYTLQWWSEPQSQISLFDIVSGYPEKELAAINQKLRARLWQEVIGWHACMLSASRFGEGEYSQTVTPTYLNQKVVSISIFTNYDCGGAHPDFGEAPINMSAKTAEPLSLEDVLWVGEGKPFHYIDAEDRASPGNSDVDFDTFAAYREKSFAHWLVKQMALAHPTEMTKPTEESDDDCDYSEAQVWNFPAWYFTEKGIYFGPTFARVKRSCESPDWSILPWTAIAGHTGRLVMELPKGH
jgi:hypothetical protein